MQIPSAIGLYFLAYLLLLLPWLARKSARRMRASADGEADAAAMPSRTRIYLNSLFGLLLLGALAYLAGRSFDYRFFELDQLGLHDVLAGAAALLLNAGFFLLSRYWRTEEERRKLMVWKLVPRSPSDWGLAVLTVLAAGVCEEIAYRGVGMSLLWWMTGSAWIAVLLSAVAFALAHALQGGRSMLIVFGMALVAHGLVAVTGTLVVAMVVHVIYDVGAMVVSARKLEVYG